ncbi:MBLC1 protein, partial [Podargus strigoides]|nr:MBLC1 protein [Podargus strigoides]
IPQRIWTSPLGSQEISGSPYTLKVLWEGYHTPHPDGTFHADGTVTLLRGGALTLLVDTGGPWDKPRLLRLLANEGVSPHDVTHVICTHGHSDHVGNLNLFPL